MANDKPKYKGVRFTTPKGRASYPKVFDAVLKYQKVDEFEYCTDLLFDAGTDTSDFEKKCDEAMAEVFGSDKKRWPKDVSYPLCSQELLIEKAMDKGQSHDHYDPKGTYARFKTNAAQGKPLVVDQNRNEILDKTSIYGGCYARVSGTIKVNIIKGRDPATKKETQTIYVTPYLSGFQFMGDGESFGGRPSATEMFEAVDEVAVDPMG